MEYANNNVLVTTEWLERRLQDGQPESLVICEVDENTALYADGHIPGAVELHWRRDLQDPLRRDVVNRATFEATMDAKGITNDSTVVVYGDKSNWFAAYAYWYLKLYGHEDVRILDGGRQKWVEDGGEMTTLVPRPEIVTGYRARKPDSGIRAKRDYVRRIIGDANGRVLVDVRSPQEYMGLLMAPPGYEQEGASRKGHIPGALSIPWAVACHDDGTFKSADDLADLYASHGVTPDRETVAYCRIGERSAHTWFVLHELLGYEKVRNYDGSWTEWGNLVDVPIER